MTDNAISQRQIKKFNRKAALVWQIAIYLVIVIMTFISLYPLAMALWNVFKSDYVYTYTKWYPTLPLRFSNLGDAFTSVWPHVLNTLLVGVAGIGGQLVIGCLASYAFAQLEFPGRRYLYALVLVLMMVPSVLTLTPSFMLYKDLKLIDTYWSLILSQWSAGSVGCIFLLHAFFRGMPKDIFDAARIDRASELRIFFSIAMPLALPILLTQTIMSIVGVWNDYLWPMITLSNSMDKLTISAALVLLFENEHSTNMPLNYAGYLIASLPLVLLFFFANRFYIEGLIGSSIKL